MRTNLSQKVLAVKAERFASSYQVLVSYTSILGEKFSKRSLLKYGPRLLLHSLRQITKKSTKSYTEILY